MRRAIWICVGGLFLLMPSACAYKGSAKTLSPEELADTGWIGLRDVPVLLQEEEADCGAAAVSMVLNYWQTPTRIEDVVRAFPELTDSGNMDASDLRQYVEQRGLSAFLFSGEMRVLEFELMQERPVIVGLVKRYGLKKPMAHYEVVVGYNPTKEIVATLDPAHGWRQNSLSGFLSEWEPSQRLTLVAFPAPEQQ
jgi:ABC-type bacteriocin/lantibiotic exporter with double-glycine peptidase domain